VHVAKDTLSRAPAIGVSCAPAAGTGRVPRSLQRAARVPATSVLAAIVRKLRVTRTHCSRKTWMTSMKFPAVDSATGSEAPATPGARPRRQQRRLTPSRRASNRRRCRRRREPTSWPGSPANWSYERLGQQFSRGPHGAGSNSANEAVVGASPDGYTLLGKLRT